MLDTINLERRGIPAAVVGQDKLLNTTGKGMARAQGYPTLKFAVFTYSHYNTGAAATDDELKERAALVAVQVESILTGNA